MSLIPAEQAADQTFNKTSINSQSGIAINNFVNYMLTCHDDVRQNGDYNNCPSGFCRRGGTATNSPRSGFWFNVLTIRQEQSGDNVNYAIQFAIQTTNTTPDAYVRCCNGFVSGTSTPNWSAWRKITTS